ncbi:MAG: outer membrane beta-barrel protein [Acidobacteria bacterium]|jgi:outer membrane protein W|nr:outer membrane beta-barrel protein [Acidobacteriota bacterium]
MRAVKALSLALVVLAACAAPAMADETSNIFRGGLQYVWVEGNTSYKIDGVNLDIDSDPGFGFYLAYEYRMKMLGIELSTAYSSHDGTGSASGLSKSTKQITGEYQMIPLSVALNFHVFGRSYVDLYLGPVVGYYFMSDDLDNAFGYGAQIGADWNLSDSGLALNTALKYMFVGADVKNLNETYDVDPLSLQVGLAWRF